MIENIELILSVYGGVCLIACVIRAVRAQGTVIEKVQDGAGRIMTFGGGGRPPPPPPGG